MDNPFNTINDFQSKWPVSPAVPALTNFTQPLQSVQPAPAPVSNYSAVPKPAVSTGSAVFSAIPKLPDWTKPAQGSYQGNYKASNSGLDTAIKAGVSALTPQKAQASWLDHSFEVNNEAIPSVTPMPSAQATQTPVPVATPRPKPTAFDLTPKQQNRVIAAVISEAGGESPQGRQGVLNSIINRTIVNPKYYGANLFDVISKPSQYTGFNVKDKNYNEVKQYLDGTSKKLTPGRLQQIQEVLDLFNKAKQGKLPDITNGATHYINPKKATDFSWVPKAQKKSTIGQHDFYYLKK